MSTKSKRIEIRLSEEEHQKLVENATACGMTISDYLRLLGTGYAPKERLSEEEKEILKELKGLRNSIIKIENYVRDKLQDYEIMRSEYLEVIRFLYDKIILLGKKV